MEVILSIPCVWLHVKSSTGVKIDTDNRKIEYALIRW